MELDYPCPFFLLSPIAVGFYQPVTHPLSLPPSLFIENQNSGFDYRKLCGLRSGEQSCTIEGKGFSIVSTRVWRDREIKKSMKVERNVDLRRDTDGIALKLEYSTFSSSPLPLPLPLVFESFYFYAQCLSTMSLAIVVPSDGWNKCSIKVFLRLDAKGERNDSCLRIYENREISVVII